MTDRSDDATEHDDPDATRRDGPGDRVRRTETPRYLDKGMAVGRYVVIDRLGEGGMGVVYTAQDPELDRKVAIKLMQAQLGGSQSGGEQAWLLREAQALAKLAHPNVVGVHDVGTLSGDRVFVAMEFVDGTTLRSWIKSDQRPWSETLPILIAAGNGLAAAHHAGLVHRDFKPDNVIVGNDGRVRVMDFGLARLHRTRTSPEAVHDTALAVEAKSPLSESLTIAGSLVGTPAYMAPEIYDGQPADKLTDQFAFGVTLFEALFRARPYTRESLQPPRTTAPKAKLPSDTKVPARIQRAVLRAISIDPAERFPSMDALLAELAFDQTAKKRRVVVAATVVATALISLGAVYFLLGGNDDARCAGSRAKLAGIWDRTVRGKLEHAFAQTKRGHAATTSARVASLFDDYAKGWVVDQTASCKATLRGDQSQRLGDLRSACMQQRVNELAALTEVFAGAPSPEVVDNAVAAALSLPSIAQCRDETALNAKIPPPADPIVRDRVDALRKRLDHVTALTRAGGFVEALEQAEQVTSEARALSYVPVRADAFSALAQAYQDAGKNDEAEALFREVIQIAGEANDDGHLATAMVGVMEASGRIPGRLAETIALAPVARGVIARVSKKAAMLTDLELTLATAYARAGKFDEARAHYDQALVHAEANADKLQLGAVNTNYGALLESQGRHDEAREKSLRAIALIGEALGADHPDLAAPLNNLANSALKQGKYDEAEQAHRRALAIMEKSLAPDHPEVATSLNNLGIVFQERGDYQQARKHYERAFELYKKLLGPDDPMVGISYNNIGEVVLLAGNAAEALSFYERAITTWKHALPDDHPLMGHPLTGMGKCKLALGAPAEAVALLERALRIRAASGEDPILAAETEFALARGLWETQHRKRAIELARHSLAAYQRAGDAATKPRAEIEKWLSAHGRN